MTCATCGNYCAKVANIIVDPKGSGGELPGCGCGCCCCYVFVHKRVIFVVAVVVVTVVHFVCGTVCHVVASRFVARVASAHHLLARQTLN